MSRAGRNLNSLTEKANSYGKARPILSLRRGIREYLLEQNLVLPIYYNLSEF